MVDRLLVTLNQGACFFDITHQFDAAAVETHDALNGKIRGIECEKIYLVWPEIDPAGRLYLSQSQSGAPASHAFFFIYHCVSPQLKGLGGE